MNPSSPRLLAFLPALAAAALTAGCNRSFHNPAAELSAGEVGGRTTVAGAGVAGVAVSVKGSLLDQGTRPSGRFGVLPLPRGPHTVLFRQGVARAAQRELAMGYGSDGQLEGLWLGEVALPRAVALSGALFADSGSTFLSGVVVDEETGLCTFTSYGDYRLQGLAVGRHRLLAATRDPDAGTTWVAEPVIVTAAPSEEGTEKILAEVPVRATTAGTGHLYLRVASAVPGLDPAAAPVHLTDAAGVTTTLGPPDSSGDRDLTLTEGLYFVEVSPPPAFTGTVPGPDRRAAVVVADNAFDLGTFTLAGDADLSAAARSCHADADCAPGSCTSGACSGAYAPPTVAPATAPLCADLPWCGTPGAACDLPGGIGGAGAGSCVLNPATATGVCVPCSTRCSIDGADVLTASACSY